MFRPVVVKRDVVEDIFKNDNVKAIVFQSENEAGDRKGKKRHRYQMAAYQQTTAGYEYIDGDYIFEDGIEGINPVKISKNKQGLTTDFGNYFLHKGLIPNETSADQRLLLFYPSLLDNSGNDAHYVKYEITPVNASNILNVIKSQQLKYRYLSKHLANLNQGNQTNTVQSARSNAEFMLNPSPPRNSEEEN